jgi:hypothetical protein
MINDWGKKLIISVFSILFILLSHNINAKEKKDFLFDSDDILNIKLSYNMYKLERDWGNKRKYHPAKLTYTDDQGKLITLDVHIRVRGDFRRTGAEFRCHVPNFKMKFDKKQAKNTIFRSKKPLKLVLHCKNYSKEFQNYVFYEYYAYKIYQMLTNFCFKVRMARIAYVGIRKKTKPLIRYGFFIENYKQMAKRNYARRVKTKKIPLQEADIYNQTLMGVFQFLIGNTDWSIRSGHNIRLIIPRGRTKYFTIPYDFDMSGLVNAEYAKPNPRLPIRQVRDRLYRGYCKDEDIFAPIFDMFNQHKAEILTLIRDSTLLPKRRKKSDIRYIERFYEIINNPKLIKRYFINHPGR